MLRRIDHIVIVVRDLNEAVEDYRQAGFTVTPGGEHLGGATHNALIAFHDGTYLELIAFREPDRPQEHKWWSRLARAEGLVDYALGTDDLAEEIGRIRRQGLPLLGPVEGGRERPDGTRLAWRTVPLGRGALAAGGVERATLPFLIEDRTPRALRVPSDEAVRHRWAVTRVAGLTLVTNDLADAARSLAAVLGVDGHVSGTPAARGGAALRFPVGDQWLELVQPADPASAMGRYLASVGEGPYELVLADDRPADPGHGHLLEGNLHGARIRVAAGLAPG